MAKGTKRQKEIAEQYANPRIGQCIVPHCKTIQPAKGRFHGLCWWHYCRIGFWAEKTGYDLGPVVDVLAANHGERARELVTDYCDWLEQRAS